MRLVDAACSKLLERVARRSRAARSRAGRPPRGRAAASRRSRRARSARSRRAGRARRPCTRQLDAPVLRQAALGDVQLGHDLDARDDRGLQPPRRRLLRRTARRRCGSGRAGGPRTARCGCRRRSASTASSMSRLTSRTTGASKAMSRRWSTSSSLVGAPVLVRPCSRRSSGARSRRRRRSARSPRGWPRPGATQSFDVESGSVCRSSSSEQRIGRIGRRHREGGALDGDRAAHVLAQVLGRERS